MEPQCWWAWWELWSATIEDGMSASNPIESLHIVSSLVFEFFFFFSISLPSLFLLLRHPNRTLSLSFICWDLAWLEGLEGLEGLELSLAFLEMRCASPKSD